jgi:hypothetical protein
MPRTHPCRLRVCGHGRSGLRVWPRAIWPADAAFSLQAHHVHGPVCSCGLPCLAHRVLLSRIQWSVPPHPLFHPHTPTRTTWASTPPVRFCGEYGAFGLTYLHSLASSSGLMESLRTRAHESHAHTCLKLERRGNLVYVAKSILSLHSTQWCLALLPWRCRVARSVGAVRHGHAERLAVRRRGERQQRSEQVVWT